MLLFWKWLCIGFGIGSILFSAVAVTIPVLITGGIHMDGFCDTIDAISSRQEKERKLAILKDPHVGAFAVIYVCVYLLLCFGMYTELFSMTVAVNIVCVGFILSRALAVWSAITILNAKKGGMLAAFKDHLEKRISLTVVISCSVFCAFGLYMLHTVIGIFCVLLCILWLFLYRNMVMRHFGGTTGDTTGFFLQMTELLILLGAVLGKFFERMM
jgi:adenosylcobinamide-GDP ribazoletransferase